MGITVISLFPGSESGERRARPKSEFILPVAEYHVPARRQQQRPQSMDIDEIYHHSNVSRTSSNEMTDRNSVPESSRKISVASNQSSGFVVFQFILCCLISMLFYDLPI